MNTVDKNTASATEVSEAKRPVHEVNVIQAVQVLIADRQAACRCLYDEAMSLVALDLRIDPEEVALIARAQNPSFVEERLVGILSTAQGALMKVPGHFKVLSAKKKKE